MIWMLFKGKKAKKVATQNPIEKLPKTALKGLMWMGCMWALPMILGLFIIFAAAGLLIDAGGAITDFASKAWQSVTNWATAVAGWFGGSTP